MDAITDAAKEAYEHIRGTEAATLLSGVRARIESVTSACDTLADLGIWDADSSLTDLGYEVRSMIWSDRQ